jgi:serine/threonine protein kinase
VAAKTAKNFRGSVGFAEHEKEELQLHADTAFKCELGIMASFGEDVHENIVRLISRVELNGMIYLTMEYCEAGALSSYLDEKLRNNRFVDEIVKRADDSNMLASDQYRVVIFSFFHLFNNC